MASSGITYCPGDVFAVTLPDKSLWPEPIIFYRQDQAEKLADEIEGAEWYECKLHMWLDGERTIEHFTAADEEERPSKFIFLQISREGAESFVSDSPGWGAMGLQEITEAITAGLEASK